MDAISFGEWLRRNRRSLGLTQAQLAGKVNCATITVRKIEAEERKPSIQIAEQLANILEIPNNERKIFVDFARGDWHMTPASGGGNYPWHSPAATNNLHVPATLTTLIGRDHDVSALKDLLAASNVRLVTLVGSPGVGKTHLSKAIAHALPQQFPDGVFFVPLASVNDEKQLAINILKSFGIKGIKNRSSLDRLIHGISDHQVLLILDNVEQLIKTASRLISELLTACAGLKILATSREVLRLDGEQVYLVHPLEAPTETQLNSLDINTASQYSALALFIERARMVQPDFSLNQKNVQAVVQICQQLDGLPLAIELLATRLNLMTPQEILSHMNGNFILYTRGLHSLPSHQETLYQAFQRSYELLTSQEQRLFSFLSVFRGGFSLPQVEGAFSDIFEHDELSVLIASLLDKSLLQIRPGLLAGPRISILNTINFFAVEQFADAIDVSTACERHLRVFLGLAKTAVRKMHQQDQLTWVSQIDMEQDNFKAALKYSLTKKDLDALITILTPLGWFWFLKGNYTELASWYEQINPLVPSGYHSKQYATLLNLLAQSKLFSGEPDHARCLLKDSLTITVWLEEDSDAVMADAMSLFGLVISAIPGEIYKAKFYIKQALALHQKIGDLHGAAMDYLYLTCVLNQAEQGSIAISMAENGLRLFEQLNDTWGKGRCYHILGQLSVGLNHFTEARGFFNHQLDADTLVGFRKGQLSAWAGLENIYHQNNDRASAGAMLTSDTVSNFERELNERSSQYILCFS